MWIDRDEDFARQTAPDTVRFERLLPGPIERIWAYLTDSEKRQRWLASGPMELRPGGAATLHFRHSDFADDATPERYREMAAGVTSQLTITEIDPPRLLSMTWPEQGAMSEVTFELFPEGQKVALVVTHRRLPNGQAMANVSGGWHAHLMALEAELGGRPLEGFWANLVRLEDRYRDEFAGGAHRVVLKRHFDASPQAVYRAWTQPEALTRWFGENVEADVRVGGRYRAENRDGSTVYVHEGTYLALEPNQLIRAAFTVPNAPPVEHQFGDEFIEVRLAPDGAGTAMTFINGWQGDPMPENDRRAVEEAWAGWLDLLAQYVNGSKGG